MDCTRETICASSARLGHGGELHEPEAAWRLLGNGHRLYSATLMRFHSPDRLSPFGRGGANAYVYCGGEPVNRVDPSGRSFQWLALGAAVVGLGAVGGGAAFYATGNEAMAETFAGIGVAVLGLTPFMLASMPRGRGHPVRIPRVPGPPAVAATVRAMPVLQLPRPGLTPTGGRFSRPATLSDPPAHLPPSSRASRHPPAFKVKPAPPAPAAKEPVPDYDRRVRFNKTVIKHEYESGWHSGSESGPDAGSHPPSEAGSDIRSPGSRWRGEP